MRDPLDWIDAESSDWSERGLHRRLIEHGPSAPGRLKREGRELVNFGSNDYLGLAADPRVKLAALRATKHHGWGARASPLVTGWSDEHRALAADLARFEQAEAVALFPSGFAANLGTISSVVGSSDAVYVDRLAHACLVDGAWLSRARLRVYPHNDAGGLAAILDRDRGRFRRSLIATEGVFSMDGDVAPLAELAEIAERFGAMLLVDEAHATGVLGPDGRGASAACDVSERVAIRVGTLSKAFGSIGGFVAGPRRLIDWLVNHARPMVYSTAPPAAAMAAARAALAASLAEPWRRQRVRVLGDRLRQQLGALGFDTGCSASPIIPVRIGDADAAMSLGDRLQQDGVFVPAIRPPTVPNGTARLRISLSAAHTDEDLARLVEVLGRAG